MPLAKTGRPLTVLTLMLGVALGVGCKKDKAVTPQRPTARPAAQGQPGKFYRVAIIAKSATPAFFAARTGAQDAAKALSAKLGIDIELDWLTPPREDAQAQAQRIAQAVNEGANAVLLSSADASTLTNAVNDAVAHGVPVMTFDSDVPQSKRFAFYGIDDFALGSEVMAELAKLLNGQGQIAILAGNRKAPDLQRRLAGAQQAAEKLPGIKVVATVFQPETSQDAAAELARATKANPGIRGWAVLGTWPICTKTLLADLDPNQVKVVAVNALPPELTCVQKGLAPVLFAQPVYLWGKVGVETIIDKIHLKRDVPTIIHMDRTRITKDNLGPWARQLKTWGFTDVAEEHLKLP